MPKEVIRLVRCTFRAPEVKERPKKCGSCVFFHTRKCNRASAGQDLILPKDLACLEYEDLRKKLTPVDIASVVEEIAAELPPPAPYESEEALYLSIVSLLKDHIIFEDQNEYYLGASWIRATWKVVKLTEACYLVIVCPKGHGKTRFIEILYELCYKAIPASYATRPAGMRLHDGGEITFLLDEGEITLKAADPDELTALFTAGQRRGQKMIIVEEVTEVGPDGKKISVRRPVAREVFGFKAVASREDVFDAIVDRAFEIVLPKGKPKNRKIDLERTKALRAQLHEYMRAGPLYDTPIPEKIADLMDGRMIELTEVLLRVTPPQYASNIMAVALKEVKERAERIADTVEAKLLTVIKEKLEDAEELKRIEGLGMIPVGEIADAYNLRFPNPKFVRSADSVGRVLSRLRLQRMRTQEANSTIRGFKYEPAKLGTLYERFLIDFKSLDETISQASSASLASSMVQAPPSVKVIPGKGLEYFHSGGDSHPTSVQSGQRGQTTPGEAPPTPSLSDIPTEPKIPLRHDKPSSKFQCATCQKNLGDAFGIFSSKEDLHEHLATKHGVEKEEREE